MSKWILVHFMVAPFLLQGQIVESNRLTMSVTIPEIALIDVAPSTSTIELNMKPPTQAGDPIDMSEANNEAKWLNYTSAIAAKGPKRSITAQILSGALPRGLYLRLEAGKYQGNGGGKTGKPKKEIVLSQSPQSILSNIGRSYTGKGVNQGHQLFFSLGYTKYEDIDFGVSTIVIAFTLTDN